MTTHDQVLNELQFISVNFFSSMKTKRSTLSHCLGTVY